MLTSLAWIKGHIKHCISTEGYGPFDDFCLQVLTRNYFLKPDHIMLRLASILALAALSCVHGGKNQPGYKEATIDTNALITGNVVVGEPNMGNVGDKY